MDRARRHAVKIYGDGEPVVIFGHGIGGSQSHWDPIVEHFRRKATVVTFALSGAVDADPSLFSPIRHSCVMGFADDLSLLCAHLGLRGAVYVGHSMSAMAGALAAVADPGLFSRLVFVNGCARYMHDPAEGYVGAFSEKEINDLLHTMAGDFTAWASGFAPIAMGNADYPEYAAEFARSLCAYDPGVILTMFRAAFTSDYRAEIPGVRPPVLLLQSSDDPAVPLKAARWLAGTLPFAELRSLESTGHFPHIVAPDEVIKEIEDHVLARL